MGNTFTNTRFIRPHRLQQLLHGVVESVSQFIDELTPGDVNTVHDGVLFAAQDAVGLAAGLQNLCVRVLLHHKLDLLEQPIQMLERSNSAQHQSNANKNMINYVFVDVQLTFSILPALYTSRSKNCGI